MPVDPQMLVLASRAAPNLPIDAHVAIASQGLDPTTTIDTAQGIGAYGDVTTQINRLKQMDDVQQRAAWVSASVDQRSLWQAAGYSAPTASRGFLGNVFHGIGAAVNAVGGAIESVPGVAPAVHGVEAGLGYGLRALGSGSELTKHLYRTGEFHNQDATPNNLLLDNPLGYAVSGLVGGALALAGSSDWSDAWHRTTHGDQTFDPNKDRRIQADSGLDAQSIAFAKAAAGSGKDIESFLGTQINSGSLDAASATALRDRLNDPRFAAVVQQYKDAKLSFGRSLVPEWMWQHVHPLATTLSGSADALFDIFADPLLVGGKLVKANQLAKYSFKSLDEINPLLEKAASSRWVDDVSSFLQTEDYAGLANRHPNLIPVMDALKTIKSRDGLVKALTPSAETPEMRSASEALTRAQEDLVQVHLDPAASGRDIKAAEKALEQATTDNQEHLGNWLASNMVSLHILAGGGSSVGHGVMTVPTLTTAGKAFLDAKGVLRQGIDWAAHTSVDVGQGGARDVVGRVLSGSVNLVGSTAKRAATLIPEGMTINPDDPRSLLQVQRFTNFYLPGSVADRVVQGWVSAPNVAAKRAIYLDMLDQTFKSAGVDMSDDASLARHFMTDIERQQVGQRYSFGVNDRMARSDGTQSTAGLLGKHLTTEWALPSYRDLSLNANRSRFNKMVYGVANNPIANTFSMIWKPAQLLRIGFPIRVSTEELLGALARNGPIDIARSALAASASKDAVKGPLHDLNPIEAGASRLLRELDQRDIGDVKSGNDLVAKVLAGRTRRFFEGAAERIPGVQSLQGAITKYPQWFAHGLPEEVSSVHLGQRFANTADEALDAVQTGMRKSRFGLTPRMRVKQGEYKDHYGGDPGYMSSWVRQLDDIAGDPLGRSVLANLDLGDLTPQQLREHIADKLLSPQNREYWQKAERSTRTSDGHVVGVDATERDAALDWADHLIDHVKGFTHEWHGGTVSDTPQAGLISHLLESGKSPDFRTLMKYAEDIRPVSVHGPTFVELPFGSVGGMLSEFVDRGFHRMGRAIDFLSRQPMFVLAVHKADKDLAPLVREILPEGTAMHDEVLAELVRARAFRDVMPYIHDPKIRSQMNILTQNLAPFQFAQEQFWKRWGRTFYHSPEAMREAELLHHSLGASGIVHTDDQGNEVFSYPLTGFAQQAVSEGFSILGIPAALPVRQAFSGQLKMVAPGMDISREFMPSFGPLVSVPLNAIARQFPETQPYVEKTLGDIATGRPYWEQIVPSSIARVVNAAVANDAISPSYASAEMRAIQDLAATKNLPSTGIGPDGKPLPMSAEQRQEFMRRVSNWTRINFFLRAAFGFAAPAAPQSAIGDTKIGQELRQLSAAGIPFTQAMQELVKTNPDASVYEVFMSQGAGKEPLPATKEAAEMLADNGDFFSGNARAGGYFLPQKSGDDKFSNEAYKEQLLYELRLRRSPKEYLEQIEYSQAASTYYATRDQYNQDVSGLKGRAKDGLSNAYQQWKAQYLNDHPVFAEKLESATSVVERHATMADLQKALVDPRAPKTAQTDDIRQLVDMFSGYQSALTQWKGISSGTATRVRQQLTADFDQRARSYIAEHPLALDVWNSLIRPEVEPAT